MTERSILDELVSDEPESTVSRLARSSWRGGLGVRIVRGVGWTFIYLGVLILGFVVHQLFVTTYFADRAQDSLAAEFAERVEDAEPAPQAVIDTATGEVVVIDPTVGTDDGAGTDGGGGIDLGDYEDQIFAYEVAPDLSEPVGNIRIPDIGLVWTVVEGVRLGSDLKKGAGHYPDTPLPGQPGNAAIAGHRTTWGQPFHNLDDLEPGDQIFWDSVTGTHVYEVREVEIVDPSALWVLDDRDGAWLTLTTCHPKFSARQRLVVFAEMVDGPNYEPIQAMAAAP